MRPWVTPVPIPNTMVKTWTAEGTILETVWESRWLPIIWGRSSVGRAPALQAGGQEFESLRLHCEDNFFTNKEGICQKQKQTTDHGTLKTAYGKEFITEM